jgi:MFS transporter, ACS family, pantothenate transporter
MASEKLQQPGSVVGEPSEDLPEVRENAWIKFMTFVHWYPKDMPSFEKRLVLKLDLMILVYGCLCFFTKYLDQASLTNAYVT